MKNEKKILLVLYDHLGVKFDTVSMVFEPKVHDCFFWC